MPIFLIGFLIERHSVRRNQLIGRVFHRHIADLLLDIQSYRGILLEELLRILTSLSETHIRERVERAGFPNDTELSPNIKQSTSLGDAL